MEVSELRIGNLVKIGEMLMSELFSNNEVVIDTDVFQIHMIDPMFINLLINNDDYEFDIKDIQPIELTEAWLKALGFKKEGVVFKKEWFDLWVFSYTKGYQLRIYKTGNDIEKLINIKHVHQLQNLYFVLTNTELEYKIIK